jgi:tripartite-type tricarboxylate transporter receptor subunit TctC
VQDKLAAMSLETQSATPRQLSEQLAKDVAKWKKIVAETGIKVQ